MAVGIFKYCLTLRDGGRDDVSVSWSIHFEKTGEKKEREDFEVVTTLFLFILSCLFSDVSMAKFPEQYYPGQDRPRLWISAERSTAFAAAAGARHPKMAGIQGLVRFPDRFRTRPTIPGTSTTPPSTTQRRSP